MTTWKPPHKTARQRKRPAAMRKVDDARAPLLIRPQPPCGRDGCNEPEVAHRPDGCIRVGCECSGWEKPGG